MNAPSGSAGEAWSSTAISTAIPRTAPIWRMQVDTALPVAKRSGGSSATAALDHAAKERPTPMPVRIVAGRKWVV